MALYTESQLWHSRNDFKITLILEKYLHSILEFTGFSFSAANSLSVEKHTLSIDCISPTFKMSYHTIGIFPNFWGATSHPIRSGSNFELLIIEQNYPRLQKYIAINQVKLDYVLN